MSYVVPEAVSSFCCDSVQVMEIGIKPIPDYIKVKRYARAEDASIKIRNSTIFFNREDGSLLGAYLRTGTRWSDLASTVEKVRTGVVNSRQSGIASESMVFGYMPRKKGRQDWCRATKVASKHPEVEARLEEVGGDIARAYKALNPALYQQHLEQAGRLLEEYRMSAGPFTSGIINYDFSLPYHFDAGNFKGMWNGMVVCRRDAVGGHTIFPELDLDLEVEDGSLALFNAQGFIHGVTPIKKLTPKGYRYSLVWYSLEQLWQCKTQEQELKEFRKRRTEQEYRRMQKRMK